MLSLFFIWDRRTTPIRTLFSHKCLLGVVSPKNFPFFLGVSKIFTTFALSIIRCGHIAQLPLKSPPQNMRANKHVDRAYL